ncbi:CbiX/SirB N-terminal domain-containing protein [Nocardiopsis sp. N85]|uniref:sirohydrochlorin chelatase n=1 Tax=Nocardiopsis sp. N85 TaxID=3029400 RepID=UPI00237F3746|nr:CbiX/SirB N-terminal domain-containing protein [Nocardiopsis sp. N85]MDE3722016.1 CbiX/SirB N-terminal domain-containing protein [Nocardiopsis sp. N85]
MNRNPTLLLAVHGTRDPRGTAVAHSLALRVAELARVPTRLAFADVLAPTVGDVAADSPGPLVVVPAFLAAGYHVRADIPEQLARAGRADAVITPALGDHPAVRDVAVRRLRRAGYRPGDAVVLGCAGTSDTRAMGDLERAADALAARLGSPVHLGFVATCGPTVADRVTELRARGHRRVAVASWLLAPGLFQRRLAACGADVVADPLCPDAAVAHAVAARYHGAAIPQPV